MKPLTKPSPLEVVKLLTWKNWRLYSRQKKQLVFEILSPFVIGIFMLLLRGLLPATGVAPVRHYPSFSPDYLPPGQIADFDDLFNTSRLTSKKVANGLCDIIRTSLKHPDSLSLRGLMSGLHKIEQLDVDNIDLTKPELLSWISNIDIVGTLEKIRMSAQNEEIRSLIEEILSVVKGSGMENAGGTLMNLVQSHEGEIRDKLKQIKNHVASADAKSKRWLVLWSPLNPLLSKIMAGAASRTPFIGCGLESSANVLEAMSRPLPFSQDLVVLTTVNFPDSLKNASSLPSTPIHIDIRFPGLSRFKFDENLKEDVVATRLSIRTTWDTSYAFPKTQTPGARNAKEATGGSPGYYREGFLGLQSSISASITAHLNQSSGGTIPHFKLLQQRLPEPKAFEDPNNAVISVFVSNSQQFLLVFVVMGAVWRITLEKESQFKESLKIVGVSNWHHWLAWYVPNLVEFAAASLVVLLIFKWPFHDMEMLRNTDSLCFFFVIFVYSTAAIAMCFFLSLFFSSASGAVTGTACIWCFIFVMNAFLDAREFSVSYRQRIWTSLVPSCAMGYAIKTINALEGIGSGLNWNTLYYKIPDSHDVPVGVLVEMMLAEAVLLLVATLYLELVLPGNGIPLPWYFPITKKFWFGSKPSPFVEVAKSETSVVEADPTGLKAGVELRNLRKVYKGGHVAVEGLTMNLYEGKITVLLGHNGAGKTTTMSMLTGMTAPSYGIAKIAGVNVSHDLAAARRNIGFCPQGNILLDNLTVKDHLYLMCALKGLRGTSLQSEIQKYIRMLQLDPKTDVFASYLSGGMKRKLSVALALCGDSKVVLFDEPTSGMDPAARRALWSLIQKEKAGRTILLSTHFMDEADLLGDRIAIMSNGRLKAAGTSFFLKKNFGGGYRIILVKNANCNTEDVTTLLREFFPGIEPATDVGAELSYLLPDHCAAMFPAALQKMEAAKKTLNIMGYGVTTATIEDVFMNVVTASNRRPSALPDAIKDEDNGCTRVSLGMEPLLTGCQLWLSQLYGLMTKNSLLRLRSMKAQLVGIIGPALIVMLAINIASVWQGTNDLPRRAFSFHDFSQGFVAILKKDSEGQPLMDAIAEIATADGASVLDLSNSSSPDEAVLSYFKEHPISAVTNFIVGIAQEGRNITSYFNNHAFHVAPLSQQLVYNAYLRAYGNESAQLTFANYPLPYTGIQKAMLQQRGLNVSYNLSYHIGVVFLILVCWIVVSRVRERTIGAQHLQMMAGVNPAMYWGVTYISDMLYSVLVILLTCGTVWYHQEEGLSTVIDMGKLFIICLTHIMSALPEAYLFSLLFDTQGFAFMLICLVKYLFGPFNFVFWNTLRFRNIMTAAEFESWQLSFAYFPSFSVCLSVQNMNQQHWLKNFCKPVFEKYCGVMVTPCCREAAQCPAEGCIYWTEDFLDERLPGVGMPLRESFQVTFIALTLLLLIHLRFFEMFRSRTDRREHVVLKELDKDVAREEKLVRAIDPNKRKDINLLVKDLSKSYGDLKAVKSLNIMVPAGECFGLLGVNGAGKTTAFRMLSGDLTPTSGDAFINGYSITHDRKQVHKLIGYCPQFDAHLEELTGRETLRMFCYLRGVPHQELELTCEKLARELLFYPHIDKKIVEYSGGNKRKLSIAVALVGDPPVLFLDEPTTGMDPVAKRYFWQVICKIRATGKTIILTSHSMEECEALCTRIGIMVQGELLCLGSPQYLKTKFAQGFGLTIKTKQKSQNNRRKDCSAASDDIHRYIVNELPGATLKEHHDSVLSYNVPATCPLTWAEMFGVLERARSENRLADYYLGQSGLEDVFLRFASAQKSD